MTDSEQQPLRNLERNMNDNQNRLLSNLIAKPEIFTGEKQGENPLLWIKQLNRLRIGLELTDNNILFLVGNHLRGKAEVWWSTLEDEIDTWAQFVKEFKKTFAPTEMQTDLWWNELENLKQQNNQSVDEIKLKIEQLSGLLNIEKNNVFKLRYFKNALRKDIQYELDRNPIKDNTWDAITEEAMRIEMVHKKHNIPDNFTYQENQMVNSFKIPTVSSASVISNKVTPSHSASNHVDVQSAITSKLDKLCDTLAELKLSVEGGSGVNGVTKQQEFKSHGGTYGGRPSYNTSSFQCYICGDSRHKAAFCPQNRMNQGQQHAEGVNKGVTVGNQDINNQGKGMGRQ
jgi:hypothetical protein